MDSGPHLKWITCIKSKRTLEKLIHMTRGVSHQNMKFKDLIFGSGRSPTYDQVPIRNPEALSLQPLNCHERGNGCELTSKYILKKSVSDREVIFACHDLLIAALFSIAIHIHILDLEENGTRSSKRWVPHC